MSSATNNATSEFNYDYESVSEATHKYPETVDEVKDYSWVSVILLVVNTIIIVFGVCGNALVIWIAGFKMKKTVNGTWYLSLAISDFMFCVILSLNAMYMANNNWVFGLFMCKFSSFIMFLNMFSSIFLLVIISIDRCISVVFPVWAQNHRTVKKALIVVTFAWTVAIALSVPSAVIRKTEQFAGKTICFNDNVPFFHSVVIARFLSGFVAPFLTIFFCYFIIIYKLTRNQMTKSSKPFKVMSALIAAFFICWLPYHIVLLIELNHKKYDLNVISVCMKVFVTLASANSILNPFLYAFMGADFKEKFWRALLSKIESTLLEETHATSRWISGSSFAEPRVSTHM